MARNRTQVLRELKETYLIPLFSSASEEEAVKTVSAVLKGGCPTIELTHRTERSLEVFQTVRKTFPVGNLLLGAGSVTDEATASLYIHAGAEFIVSPAFLPEVLAMCNRRNLLHIPGCATPTEMLAAYAAGAVAVKIFPAQTLGGPAFLKAVRAPCPWIEAIPAGGVEPTAESIRSWMEAGAVAVGMGSNLLKQDLIASKRWDAVMKAVTSVIGIIRAQRSEMDRDHTPVI